MLHGASFYNGGKIVLGMTMRCRENGIFWFSLFHELAHIVLGHIRQGGTTKEDEDAADAWAEEHLIDVKKYASFVAKNDFSKSAIQAFAEKCGISAGIVVGRLQKNEHIKYSQFNSLKTRYDFPQAVHAA